MIFKTKFILASSSQSRYDLLKRNKLNFIRMRPVCNEDIIKKKLLIKKYSPKSISLELARIKAKSISIKTTNKLIVGSDTVIHPGVTLEGRTVIGSRCELHSGTRILDSSLGDEVTVNNHCVIIESSIDTGARVGPFAHLRPDSNLGPRARIGNFVEIKNSTIGNGSKANHLSYVGDAIVEAGVNIGAGTITCNYDGATKHQTKLESGVFVGSGTQLVAPVTVGRGAYVGAGSCITDDVPPGALGIARGRQTNKLNWVKKDAD